MTEETNGAVGEAAPDQDAPRRGAADQAAPEQEPKKGSKTRRRAVIIILLLLLLVGAAVCALLLFGGDDIFDPNAKTGQAPYKTAEEIQAELDRTVEEGMFNISIASAIEFEDGTVPGTAFIENVPGNRYLMKVAVTLDDTGETVHESKAIKPDSYVENIELSKDLDAGSYAATATFTALDQDSHKAVGKAAAKVTLIVKG